MGGLQKGVWGQRAGDAGVGKERVRGVLGEVGRSRQQMLHRDGGKGELLAAGSFEVWSCPSQDTLKWAPGKWVSC